MSAGPPLPADLWDSLPPEARALIQALRAEAAEMQARVRALQRNVQELQERLNQNSTNSSRPPSTDPSTVKRRPPSPASGRLSGGQPGHERQRRPLLPPDHVQILKPTRCRRCGHALRGDDPKPLRHQVLELPKIRPDVTEYQLHRLCCFRCGVSSCASLPAGVPTGGQGPRLQALLALMARAYRMSKRMVQTFYADVLGVPVCAGQVCASEAETAAATDPVVGELREYVRGQPANGNRSRVEGNTRIGPDSECGVAGGRWRGQRSGTPGGAQTGQSVTRVAPAPRQRFGEADSSQNELETGARPLAIRRAIVCWW